MTEEALPFELPRQPRRREQAIACAAGDLGKRVRAEYPRIWDAAEAVAEGLLRAIVPEIPKIGGSIPTRTGYLTTVWLRSGLDLVAS